MDLTTSKQPSLQVAHSCMTGRLLHLIWLLFSNFWGLAERWFDQLALLRCRTLDSNGLLRLPVAIPFCFALSTRSNIPRSPILACSQASIVFRCPGSTMLLAHKEHRDPPGSSKYLPIVQQIILFGVPGASLQQSRQAQLRLCCGTRESCKPPSAAVSALIY
jgi:hypothetical protein